jgi:hypothetical protein
MKRLWLLRVAWRFVLPHDGKPGRKYAIFYRVEIIR